MVIMKNEIETGRLGDMQRIVDAHGSLETYATEFNGQLAISAWLRFETDVQPTFAMIGAALDAVVAEVQADGWTVMEVEPYEMTLVGCFNLRDKPATLVSDRPIMYRLTVVDSRK